MTAPHRPRLSSPRGLSQWQRMREAVTRWLIIASLGAVVVVGVLLLLALSALLLVGVAVVVAVGLLVVLLRGWPSHGETKPWRSSRW